MCVCVAQQCDVWVRCCYYCCCYCCCCGCCCVSLRFCQPTKSQSQDAANHTSRRRQPSSRSVWAAPAALAADGAIPPDTTRTVKTLSRSLTPSFPLTKRGRSRFSLALSRYLFLALLLPSPCESALPLALIHYNINSVLRDVHRTSPSSRGSGDGATHNVAAGAPHKPVEQRQW